MNYSLAINQDPYHRERQSDEKLGSITVAGVAAVVSIIVALTSLSITVATLITNAQAEKKAAKTQAEINRISGVIAGLEQELTALNGTIEKVKAMEKSSKNTSYAVAGTAAAIIALLSFQ